MTKPKLIEKAEFESKDSIFIKHIESHSEVQNAPTHQGKAMCKVCGKLAEDIIKQYLSEGEKK